MEDKYKPIFYTARDHPEWIAVTFSKVPEPTISFAEFSFQPWELDMIPRKSGCYAWLKNDLDVLYVGKANELRSRILNYRTGFLIWGGEHTSLIIWLTESYFSLETFLIQHYAPFANRKP